MTGADLVTVFIQFMSPALSQWGNRFLGGRSLLAILPGQCGASTLNEAEFRCRTSLTN